MTRFTRPSKKLVSSPSVGEGGEEIGLYPLYQIGDNLLKIKIMFNMPINQFHIIKIAIKFNIYK